LVGVGYGVMTTLHAAIIAAGIAVAGSLVRYTGTPTAPPEAVARWKIRSESGRGLFAMFASHKLIEMSKPNGS